MTSDEQESTIYQVFQLFKKMLTADAFYGNGPIIGSQVIMIDDSIAERLAIEKAWPQTVLLCTFHFLQRRWAWLHDAKNGVKHNEDRLVLIKKIQNMVYASSEHLLVKCYTELLEKTPESSKYPSFLKQVKSLWEKRKTWAHCYRKTLPVRGNHTNNYAEAGNKILKELVFSLVKAYNLTQLFSFVTEVMEIYYQKKILSLANNRVESYVQGLRFQGLNSHSISKEDITHTENGWYKIQSQTNRGEYYSLNTNIGFCTVPEVKMAHPVHTKLLFSSNMENIVSTSSAVVHL